MASASIPPTANHESNARIGISIGLLIVLVVVVIFAAGFVNKFRSRRVALRPAGNPYMIQSQQRTGIGRFQLASIPIVKYQAGLWRDEQGIVTHAPQQSRHYIVPSKGRVIQKKLSSKATSLGTCEKEPEDASLNDPGPGRPSCSICTECFQESENVRVLPCSHIFHWQCIDPWLLNFSGTCPLWLVNLQCRKMCWFSKELSKEM